MPGCLDVCLGVGRRGDKNIDLATIQKNLNTLLEVIDMPLAGHVQVNHLRDRLTGELTPETLPALFQEFVELLGNLKASIQSVSWPSFWLGLMQYGGFHSGLLK